MYYRVCATGKIKFPVENEPDSVKTVQRRAKELSLLNLLLMAEVTRRRADITENSNIMVTVDT